MKFCISSVIFSLMLFGCKTTGSSLSGLQSGVAKNSFRGSVFSVSSKNEINLDIYVPQCKQSTFVLSELGQSGYVLSMLPMPVTPVQKVCPSNKKNILKKVWTSDAPLKVYVLHSSDEIRVVAKSKGYVRKLRRDLIIVDRHFHKPYKEVSLSIDNFPTKKCQKNGDVFRLQKSILVDARALPDCLDTRTLVLPPNKIGDISEINVIRDRVLFK